MAATRRDLLIALAALAAGYGAVRLLADAASGSDLAFEPMARPEGFRRLAGAGATSGLSDPFAGIAVPGEAAPPARPRIPDDRLCAALFAVPAPAGAVPVASFTDHDCAPCRALAPRLAALDGEGAIALTWHDLPLLGEASKRAARAVAAAGLQGGADAMRARLAAGAARPTDARVAEVAGALGLDAGRLLADMRARAVEARIATAEALASWLEVIGTPTTAVGRTVVTGAIDDARLRRLVAIERAAGPVPGCA